MVTKNVCVMFLWARSAISHIDLFELDFYYLFCYLKIGNAYIHIQYIYGAKWQWQGVSVRRVSRLNMSKNVVIVSEMGNTLQRGHGKVTTEQQQTTEVKK